ncbi:MFS transporter [Spirosoma sp. KUDC1026]|uniref:MFS transporter n=1 Tax=Spirosoma sp. KUDC1026 TaxID=2745947 RepID=UPI00159B8917|nr:MFS transporter [Spirosoma sp. KUDC1026]QKZ13237.1 MFS transporter [Spirosoma sp. KUDC1026]
MFQRTIHLYRDAYRGLSPSVWLLAGVMLVNRCGTMVLPYLTLYLTQHLHYSVADAGIVMAVFGVGAFLGTFLGGQLVDRFGFYYVQLLSLVFSGAFLLFLQFVTHFYALCGSVFVFTLFGESFRPANQAAIAHYSIPENRTRAFSLNRLAINLGWAIGGGLGGWIAGIQYSLLFWTDGLTCLLAGLFLWLALQPPRSQATNDGLAALTSSIDTERFMSPYRDTPFVIFAVLATLYFIVFMQLFSIIPLYLKEAVHLSESQIGLLISMNGVIIVCVEMALVYTLERRNFPKIRLIIAGILLATVSYTLLTLPATWVNALLFTLGITFSEMLVMPFFQSFTVERSQPATRGKYLALYAMAGALAQTLAPMLGAQLVANLGFQLHWLVVAVISLVAALGFWRLGPRLSTPLDSGVDSLSHT